MMDINNILYFKKIIIPCTYTNLSSSCTIPVTCAKPIDCITISIRHPDLYYQQIKQLFSDNFTFGETNRVKNNTIVTSYYCENKLIQLKYYKYTNFTKYRSHFFSVIIHDPNDDIQIIIRNMLMTLNSNITDTAYITKIEFDLDLYANDHRDLFLVKTIVDKHIYLRFSRKNSYSSIEDTEYQGKNGICRKGTKGLRCYPKSSVNGIFERIELVANSKFIKDKLNLDILSLPIAPNIVDINDYIEFRNGDLDQTFSAVSEIIDKKRKFVGDKNTMCELVRSRAIYRTLSGGHDMHIEYDREIPVAQLISGYRKLKKYYHLTHQIDYFFPKFVPMRIRTIGPQIGYICNDVINF